MMGAAYSSSVSVTAMCNSSSWAWVTVPGAPS